MRKVKVILPVLMSLWLLLFAEVGYGRYAAIMIDAGSGKVLHEVDATQSWYPASLTKVMTLYMTFESLKNGQLHFFDAMRTSSHAARQPTSKLGLRTGEYLTVRDAILAIITRSANDAAVVLAEQLGGSEENFAVKMTEKAHELGMSNTRFMNATGLPNDWQVTTPKDMAVLAWKIQRHFPEYYQHFSAHSFNYKGAELRGINKFVLHYPGAEGMKTGFTCGSGYNLIASAQQNGKRLIGVVMGGMTSAERYQLMYRMMDAGFDNSLSGDQEKNIESMPNGYSGTPPYQLGCGNGAYLHSAPSYKSSGLQYSSRHKSFSGKKRVVKRTRVGKYKSAGKSVRYVKAVQKKRLGNRINAKQRTLIASHRQSSKSSLKTSSKKISRPSSATPKKAATKTKTGTRKNSRTRYRHSNAR